MAKLTKDQLRKMIAESLLTEEEYDYYRDYKAGTITYDEYKQMVKDFQSNQPRYQRKTTFVGRDANSMQIAAVERLAPRSGTFLASILDQLKKGRGLSAKQKAVVRKILMKKDAEAVSLFEGEKIKVTKRQLRKMIAEEKAKLNEGFKEMEAQLIEDLVDMLIDRGVIGAGADSYKEAHGYLVAIMPTLKSMADDEGMWSDEKDYEIGFKR